jgi:hypothetical protein
MASAAEQKTDWNLGETVIWVSTRDHSLILAMSDSSEAETITRAFFDLDRLPKGDAVITVSELRRSLPPASPVSLDRQIRWLETVPPRKPSPDLVLQEITRSVRAHRVQLTMRPCEPNNTLRVAVSPSEANDLEFRLTGHWDEPVAVWSRSAREQVGTSPRFSRRDVLRLWPEWVRRTVALTAAIRGYVEEISTPEAPLTKAEARERCLKEVPGARPRAFEKAWARVDPARKRGRGKHGSPRH